MEMGYPRISSQSIRVSLTQTSVHNMESSKKNTIGTFWEPGGTTAVERCGIFTARTRRIREGNSFSLFVCLSTPGGVPHLHPIILDWLHVLSGGTPYPGMGYPLARSGQGVPENGVPPFRGWGTPWIGQHREYLLRAGGMPLAFTQEDFLVWIRYRELRNTKADITSHIHNLLGNNV